MNINAQALSDLLVDIFEQAGCERDEAERIAHHLVAADLAGHPSHGVVRTIQYVSWLAEGWVRAGQQVEVVIDRGPLLVLDGGFGFGQTIGHQAVVHGLDRVARHGVAVVGLRHSGHLGRIADWAEQAADRGVVSIHFVNVSGRSLVAPFGARSRRFGTDPVAIGIPQGDRPPILIDFATSVVAEGKARVALLGGAPVPDDAFVGPDGSISGDPRVLYGPADSDQRLDPRAGPGALRAMGDQKGSALALACELLAGTLIGSLLSGDETFCNGMLSIYLSPDAFGAERFAAEAAAFADHVRAAEAVDDAGRVSVPGDLERERSERGRRNGIELADGTWAQIRRAGAMVGVEVVDP